LSYHLLPRSHCYIFITTANMILIYQVVLCLALLLTNTPGVFGGRRIRKDNEPNARTFTVRNLSLSHVEVYWINLVTEERKLQFDLVPGASNRLNSHVVHEFEIREVEKDNVKCHGNHDNCRKRFFQISEEEEQIFTVTRDFSLEISNSKTRAQERAQEAVKGCRDLEQYLEEATCGSPFDHLERLTECMKANVEESLYETQEEIVFQADIRKRLGSQLKEYACSDPNAPTTEPIYEEEWNPSNPHLHFDDLNHNLKVLLHVDTNMIAIIENMVTPSDCEDLLTLASTNEEDPTIVPWDLRKETVSLDMLSRIYAYVNPAAKQMSMYAGLPQKGMDIFKVHHDSIMLPQKHLEPTSSSSIGSHEWPVTGNSYARLFMFCEVPDENGGGAMHFPESGAHIQPKFGEGLLVTYTRPSEGVSYNEKFFNEHAECPLLSGNRTMLEHVFRLHPAVA